MGSSHFIFRILLGVLSLALTCGLVDTTPVPSTGRAPTRANTGHNKPAEQCDSHHQSLSRQAQYGWEFYARIMLSDVDDAAAIIDETFSATDDRKRKWQRDDLTSSGRSEWSARRPQCSVPSLAGAFNHLELQVPTVCQHWVQSRVFEPYLYTGLQMLKTSLPRLKATDATIEFSYDAKKGLITLVQAQSPFPIMQARLDAGQLPPNARSLKGLLAPSLSRLSDVLGYALATEKKGSRKLQYIAFAPINGSKETSDLINTIVANFHQNNARLSLWPGVSISIGDWAFNALLTVDAFKGLPWLLAQRKSSLGHMTLSKVWIFQGDDANNGPCAIWEIETVTPALLQAAEARHKLGFAIGVKEGLRRAPAGTEHEESQHGTKRPAGEDFESQPGKASPSDGWSDAASDAESDGDLRCLLEQWDPWWMAAPGTPP